MADFHLDNDVPVELAAFLRTAGHTVVTAGELGMASAPDHAHLLSAATAGRVLIVHNWKDFRRLHYAWVAWSQAWGAGRDHAGILSLVQAPIAELRTVIAEFLHAESSLTNRLWRWTPGSGWVDHSE